MTEPSGRSVLRVTLLLMALGAVMGALAAIPLTMIGKVIAGADPATFANYLWNARAFGIMGALTGPLIAWAWLRRVPLWRAALQPTVGGLLGATAGMLIGVGTAFVGLAITGIGLGAWQANRAYRGMDRLEHTERAALAD